MQDYRETLLAYKQELQHKEQLQDATNRKQEVLQILHKKKSESCCESCGENHQAVLVFYHPRMREKFSSTSLNKKCRNPKVARRLLTEATVLCENCYYKEHPENHDDIEPKRQQIRKWVEEKKAKTGCECGEKDARCLALMRMDGKNKRFSIAEVFKKKMKKAEILEHMDKYQVICINCMTKMSWEKQIENSGIGE